MQEHQKWQKYTDKWTLKVVYRFYIYSTFWTNPKFPIDKITNRCLISASTHTTQHLSSSCFTRVIFYILVIVQHFPCGALKTGCHFSHLHLHTISLKKIFVTVIYKHAILYVTKIVITVISLTRK